jgi:hypothetical protein
MQSTQLVTILGGGAGYLLSANSYMAEVVEPEERTAAFGVLAGIAMLGMANGAFQHPLCIVFNCLATQDTSAAA